MNNSVKVKGYRGRLVGVGALARALGKNVQHVSRVLNGHKKSRALMLAAGDRVMIATPDGKFVPLKRDPRYKALIERGTGTLKPGFDEKLEAAISQRKITRSKVGQ